MPVDLDNRVVDIDEHQIVDPGHHRGRCGETAQHPGGHGIELANVTEGEGRRNEPSVTVQTFIAHFLRCNGQGKNAKLNWVISCTTDTDGLQPAAATS